MTSKIFKFSNYLIILLFFSLFFLPSYNLLSFSPSQSSNNLPLFLPSLVPGVSNSSSSSPFLTLKDIFDTPYGKWLITKAKEYFNIDEKTVRNMSPKQLQSLDKAIKDYELKHTPINVPIPIPNLPTIEDPWLPFVPHDPFLYLPPFEDHPDYPHFPSSPKEPDNPTPPPQEPIPPKQPPSTPPSKKKSFFFYLLFSLPFLFFLFFLGIFIWRKRQKKIILL